MKKIFLTVLILIVFAVFLIGCTESATTITTTEPPDGPYTGPTHTLTFYADSERGTLIGPYVQNLGTSHHSVAITARAAPGYRFVGWSDGISSATRAGITITQDTTITALFSPLFSISYGVNPPRGGTISGSSHQYITDCEGTTEVRAVAAVGFRFIGWSDNFHNNNPVRSGDTITRYAPPCRIYAIFEPVSLVVPTMRIYTENDQHITTRDYFLQGTLSTEGSLNPEHNLTDIPMQIRGRGNSSWNWTHNTKPSYRLRLDDRHQLLGLGGPDGGAYRQWILFSSHTESTFLRGWSMMRFGQLLDGFAEVTDSMHIHLYLNGDYRGLYILICQIRVSDTRVSVNDNTDTREVGFLVEMDRRAFDQNNPENAFYLPLNSFTRPGRRGYTYMIRSNVNHELGQWEFVREYITNVHLAFMSGDFERISELVCIASLVDAFILFEFSADVDQGTNSFFMQRDVGGLLKFTTPWDFDFALGNITVRGPEQPFNSAYGTNFNMWFRAALRTNWFRPLVAARMAEVDPLMRQVIREVEIMQELLAEHTARNFQRWPVRGWSPPNFPFRPDNYVSFMNRRWTFMLNHFNVRL